MARALEDPPDLILLDVVLDGEDGVELCRRIKAEPSLRRSFVALASGKNISPEDLAAGLDAGAEQYLRRPLTKVELLAQVDTLLRLRRSEEELRRSEERFRTVTEDLPILVCRFDQEGGITYVNRAYLEFFDRTETQLLGRSFLDR